jgi:predicted nucleic acid-binding protein
VTRAALDTNILAYLAGVSRDARDDAKINRARDLIHRLGDKVSLVAPAQTLGELFVVLRRSGASSGEARAILVEFAEAFATSASETRTALAAADLVVDHQLQFWDALIVTSAAEAGCSLLLSEDMQDGFVARGLTLVNPLADTLHPKLKALLDA